MLTTVASVLQMPGFQNQAGYPLTWVTALVPAADRAIKEYCKRDLEVCNYQEYYSGNWNQDIILRQTPVFCGQTQIDTSMNGLSLPQSTITVLSTEGFPPGPTAFGSVPAASISIQVGTSPPSQTQVTYTSINGTQFLGCSGGTGTLATGQLVANPLVWQDPNGYWGKTQNGFAPLTLLTMGTNYAPWIDRGMKSKRGLIRCIAGQNMWWPGYWSGLGQGKLAASRLPSWPWGMGNIKVCYSAGFDTVPPDLQQACNMLVAQLCRIVPSGTDLSSENLGGYSYSTLVNGDNPEMGNIRRMLAVYREPSFGATGG